MSKLKLEHGVSRIRRAKLQSSIDQTVADDIELLAQWSNNETNYVVNELLRFAPDAGRRLPEIQGQLLPLLRCDLPAAQSPQLHPSSQYPNPLRRRMQRQLTHSRGIHPCASELSFKQSSGLW